MELYHGYEENELMQDLHKIKRERLAIFSPDDCEFEEISNDAQDENDALQYLCYRSRTPAVL